MGHPRTIIPLIEWTYKLSSSHQNITKLHQGRILLICVFWKLTYPFIYLSLYYPMWAILSYMYYTILWTSQVVLMLKKLPTNTGDIRVKSSIHGSGRFPGGHGKPLQYSCLENPWTEEPGRVRRVSKRDNWLTFIFSYYPTNIRFY